MLIIRIYFILGFKPTVKIEIYIENFSQSAFKVLKKKRLCVRILWYVLFSGFQALGEGVYFLSLIIVNSLSFCYTDQPHDTDSCCGFRLDDRLQGPAHHPYRGTERPRHEAGRTDTLQTHGGPANSAVLSVSP